MTIDTTAVGHQVAKQMEAIEKDFADKEGYSVGPIVTIVGIQGDEGMHFRIRHNVPDAITTLGVIRMAEQQWLGYMQQPGGE